MSSYDIAVPHYFAGGTYHRSQGLPNAVIDPARLETVGMICEVTAAEREAVLEEGEHPHRGDRRRDLTDDLARRPARPVREQAREDTLDRGGAEAGERRVGHRFSWLWKLNTLYASE